VAFLDELIHDMSTIK